MTYEFNGRKYEQASSHQTRWGSGVLAELALRGDERVLDLGCGNGALTERLADVVPDGSVLGIDASEGMLEAAYEKKKPNLEFRQMDIENLQVSGPFDLIFSNAALHWVKDHGTLWRDIESLLSKTGAVRFNFAAQGNCHHFCSIIRRAMDLPEYRECFREFVWPWFTPDVQQYREILKPYRFSEVDVWEQNADTFFPDRQAIIGWINQPSIVPFLRHVPEDKKEGFRHYVIDRMLEETRKEDGTYFETFRRINVRVKK
ncbi:MAG: class I SAM-dependent methyltransferase [Chitinivibrionales bacterium]